LPKKGIKKVKGGYYLFILTNSSCPVTQTTCNELNTKAIMCSCTKNEWKVHNYIYSYQWIITSRKQLIYLFLKSCISYI